MAEPKVTSTDGSSPVQCRSSLTLPPRHITLPCILVSFQISGSCLLLQLQCQVAGTTFDGNSVASEAGETSAVSQVSNSTGHRSALVDFIIFFMSLREASHARTSLCPP